MCLSWLVRLVFFLTKLIFTARRKLKCRWKFSTGWPVVMLENMSLWLGELYSVLWYLLQTPFVMLSRCCVCLEFNLPGVWLDTSALVCAPRDASFAREHLVHDVTHLFIANSPGIFCDTSNRSPFTCRMTWYVPKKLFHLLQDGTHLLAVCTTWHVYLMFSVSHLVFSTSIVLCNMRHSYHFS